MRTKMMPMWLGCSLAVGVLLAADAPLPTTGQTTVDAQADKKATVARVMQLPPEQEKIFWPLYDAYQIDINKFNANRAAVVNKLAINQDSMTDQLALELLDKAVDVEKQRLDLKKELVEKFSKNLPPRVVARYYELETKLDAAITAHIAGQVPMVK